MATARSGWPTWPAGRRHHVDKSNSVQSSAVDSQESRPGVECRAGEVVAKAGHLGAARTGAHAGGCKHATHGTEAQKHARRESRARRRTFQASKLKVEWTCGSPQSWIAKKERMRKFSCSRERCWCSVRKSHAPDIRVKQSEGTMQAVCKATQPPGCSGGAAAGVQTAFKDSWYRRAQHPDLFKTELQGIQAFWADGPFADHAQRPSTEVGCRNGCWSGFEWQQAATSVAGRITFWDERMIDPDQDRRQPEEDKPERARRRMAQICSDKLENQCKKSTIKHGSVRM